MTTYRQPGGDGCQILYPHHSDQARRARASVGGLDGQLNPPTSRPPGLLCFAALIALWCVLCMSIVVVGNWMLEGVRILSDWLGGGA